MARVCILGSLLLTAASCDAPQPAKPETSAPVRQIPKALCDETQEALDKLQNESGLILGNPAMVDQEAWLQMGDAAQTRVGQALAVHAACRAGAPTDQQEVEIRSNMGVLLMKRAFDLTDIGAAYDAQQR